MDLSTCLIDDDRAKMIDDTLELIIKYNGERQVIIMNSSNTIDDLSRKISQVLNTPKDFGIQFESKNLNFLGFDGQKTLEACGIPDHSTIYLLSRMGGGREDLKPVDFSSLTPGTIVREGLSLEGICQSNKCCGYQIKVIIHKGFGDFNMNKEVHDTRCPLCENKTKDNFAPYFYQCKFIIEGLKVGENNEFQLEGTHNESKSCKTFKSEGLDKSDWEWLIIKVETL